MTAWATLRASRNVRSELDTATSKLVTVKTELATTTTELSMTRPEVGSVRTQLATTAAQLETAKTLLHTTKTSLVTLTHDRNWVLYYFHGCVERLIVHDDDLSRAILRRDGTF